MKLLISAEIKERIAKLDEKKKVRIFDRAEVERRFNEVLDLRARLFEVGGCRKDLLKAPFVVDLTAGMPVYHAGPRGGLTCRPVGDWFKILWDGKVWRIVDVGRW